VPPLGHDAGNAPTASVATIDHQAIASRLILLRRVCWGARRGAQAVTLALLARAGGAWLARRRGSLAIITAATSIRDIEIELAIKLTVADSQRLRETRLSRSRMLLDDLRPSSRARLMHPLLSTALELEAARDALLAQPIVLLDDLRPLSKARPVHLVLSTALGRLAPFALRTAPLTQHRAAWQPSAFVQGASHAPAAT